jgi:hypothetical protein
VAKPAVRDSAGATLNATGLFARRPKLPLVPPSFAGESLSGWVQAMADTYGLNWRNFLQVLGLPAPRRLRSLSMEPSRRWLEVFADKIGIDEASIRNRMTLGQLSRDMAAFVYSATPCQACSTDVPSGRSRPVEWLADLAPWTLTCDRHSCAVLAGEIGDRRRRRLIDHDVKLLSSRLRAEAPYIFSRPFRLVPLSAARCFELVRAVNDRVRLRVRMGWHSNTVFDVEGVLTAPHLDGSSQPWPRNSKAVSAWYAWHLLTAPDAVLWRHTRCCDDGQVYDLLTALFDPGQMGVTSPMWDYALSLCVAAATGAPRTDAEARQQIRKVTDVRLRCQAGRTMRSMTR